MHEPITPRATDALSRFRLDGKVAIVTGGTRGIGLAIATTLARAGAKVVISSRKADAHELAARTVEHFDGIDIIVNNAATNPVFGPLQLASEDAFDKILAVNVTGPLELCKTAHTVMAQRGGAIVNVSSIGGISPEAGLGLYSVSKAALVSLTKVMAQEWGADGIRANVICPGLIKTRFSQALWQDQQIADQVLGHQPIRRIGEPDDVAGLALFLASDASAYCTGGVYMVDGGYLT